MTAVIKKQEVQKRYEDSAAILVLRFIYLLFLSDKNNNCTFHGGELRDLNDSVHGILCRYSDKTSKINLS